jgi:hypothetical protein
MERFREKGVFPGAFARGKGRTGNNPPGNWSMEDNAPAVGGKTYIMIILAM